MRGIRTLTAAAGMMVVLAGTAAAQRNWTGQIFAGYPVPVSSNLTDYTSGSFSWGGGVKYSPEDAVWGIRFDIRNSRFSGDEAAIRQLIIDSTGVSPEEAYTKDGYFRTWDFTLAGEIGTPKANKVRVYALGGVGFHNKYSALTEPTVVGGCYWDPWWGYICGSGVADEVVAHRSNWEFGFNAGGGVSLNVGRGARVFIEAVYTSIGGSTVTTTDGERKSKSVGYVPIYIGVSF